MATDSKDPNTDLDEALGWFERAIQLLERLDKLSRSRYSPWALLACGPVAAFSIATPLADYLGIGTLASRALLLGFWTLLAGGLRLLQTRLFPQVAEPLERLTAPLNTHFRLSTYSTTRIDEKLYKKHGLKNDSLRNAREGIRRCNERVAYLTGPTGCGKSSFLAAYLRPYVSRDGDWQLLTLSGDTPERLKDLLTRTPQKGKTRRLRFVVLDQVDEVIVGVEKQSEADEHIVAEVLSFLRSMDDDTRVVIAIRSGNESLAVSAGLPDSAAVFPIVPYSVVEAERFFLANGVTEQADQRALLREAQVFEPTGPYLAITLNAVGVVYQNARELIPREPRRFKESGVLAYFREIVSSHPDAAWVLEALLDTPRLCVTNIAAPLRKPAKSALAHLQKYQLTKALANDSWRLSHNVLREPLRITLTSTTRRGTFLRRAAGIATAVGLAASVLLFLTAEQLRLHRIRQELSEHNVLVDSLIAQAQGEALWPQLPHRTKALEEWLAAADGLDQLLVKYVELKSDPTIPAHIQMEIAELVEDIVLVTDRTTGLRDGASLANGNSVRARLEVARSLTQPDSEESSLPQGCPVTAELARQLGLVYLGNHHSSDGQVLPEFAVLGTGSIPKRDRVTGTLETKADSAVVLVLLMGGEHVVSTRRGQDKIRLWPFLIGKYEITQSQWLSICPVNPSEHNPRELPPKASKWEQDTGREFSLQHPVERVSWGEASKWLMRVGLELPTASQWEFACAVTSEDGKWAFEHAEQISRYANVADRRSLDWHEIGWATAEHAEDDYPFTAPVGSFEPNRNGLYDFHGNIWEWTRDLATSDIFARRLGDGLRGERLNEGPTEHIHKGGCFYYPESFAEATLDDDAASRGVYHFIGFRAALTLRPSFNDTETD